MKKSKEVCNCTTPCKCINPRYRPKSANKRWTDNNMLEFARKVSWRPTSLLETHLSEYKQITKTK